jgi:DNA-binding beta-propeller fold protein YncE
MRPCLRPLFGALAFAFASACSGGPAPVIPGGSSGVPALGGAAKQNLLYVSDDTAGKVYMYSYPWGKLEGTISKLSGPSSICTDDAGHVWILESYASTILEFDHGGTKPIATLQDPGYWPSDCAVNPKTGDLAVANVFTATGGQGSPGNLVVYTKAKGKPHAFTTAALNNYMYVTFDDSGNLFLDGFGAYNNFALAELPAGAKSMTPITIDRDISPGSTGDVKWDGKYVAVADAGANAIYRIVVNGTKGKTIGTTSLQGIDSGYLAHICFPKVTRRTGEAGRVILPNSTSVGFWAYPAGGNMKRRVAKSLLFALGAAVSKGP